MEKLILKNIIKDYLYTSSFYAKNFYQNYKNRYNYEGNDYNVIIHGIGIHIIDKKKLINIDFDYFCYDGENIKYFDLWKLNLYCKIKYNYEISKDDINKLLLDNCIKRYQDSIYYYLCG